MHITVDFETYYDDLYSLQHMSMLEYITDPRFKVHMMGVQSDGARFILRPHEIEAWLTYQEQHRPITIIAQNAQFDGLILSQHYGFIADSYVDTRAMSKGLWPHASASLKALAERLWPNDPGRRKGTDLAASKGVKDFDDALFSTIADYCRQDVELTIDAANAMLTEHAFPETELEIINIVTRWCVEPQLHLDFDLMERYIPKLETERRQLIAASALWRFAASYNPDSKQRPQFVKEFETELTKGRVTPEEREYWLSLKVLNSNKAFASYLQTQKIAIPQKLNAKGASTSAFAKNDPAFIELAAAHPQLAPVWQARAAAKSTQALTRAQRFVSTARRFNGKMPMPVQYNAAHTGRLGGTEGLNVQNLERNARPDHADGDLRPGALRRALLAPDGHVVVVGDLSNIEARILAYLADHATLLEIFADGGDPYCWMASKIYNMPITKKDNPFQRLIGKVSVLGLGYGCGDKRFQQMLNSGPMGEPPIHFDDPQMYARIVATYRRDNAPIVSLWALGNTFIEMMAKPETRYDFKMLTVEHERIRLPSGLALHYPQLTPGFDGWTYHSREAGDTKKIYGAALIENICQALANCCMKDAMRRAEAAGLTSVLQVHDELVCIAPETNATAALETLLDCLTTVPDWAPGLPVAAEGGTHRSYLK